MFDMYLYYIVSLIISLLLKKSMSVGCVLAFIHDFVRTWTSVYVNVCWNSWDNNMAGYGLKDWRLIPSWGMEFVLCQASYRAHPTSYPLGCGIWSWPLSCGAEVKLYCLSFIYLWGMVLNHRDSFLFTFTLLCGLVVRVPGYRSRRPGSIPSAARFFLRSSGSGTGSTQPREDNWGAISRK
jgi:hypothetical protein